MILQDGPRGFVLGTAAKWVDVADWAIEWRPAWIRETDAGADVIWIDHRGDYSGLFQRVPADHIKLAA
jgi:hypothetical protein